MGSIHDQQRHERKVRELNDLLRTSLGQRDWVHEWRYADTLMVQGIEVDSNGEDVMETVCFCGVDVAVHVPACSPTLWLRRKKSCQTRALPDTDDQWVICRLHHPDPEEWVRIHGSHTSYPANGVWFPLSVGDFYIMTKPHRAPTKADTLYAIAVLDAARGVTGRDVTRMYEEQDTKDAREWEDNAVLAIQEEAGDGRLFTTPGKKSNTSWPEVKPESKPDILIVKR